MHLLLRCVGVEWSWGNPEMFADDIDLGILLNYLQNSLNIILKVWNPFFISCHAKFIIKIITH